MASDKENDLHRALKQRRLMTNMTLQKLSRSSGVSASHIGRIERGERFPSARVLRRIAKALGLYEVEVFTLAGYLTPQSSSALETDIKLGQLDPYVAAVLSQESVETQRAAVAILTIMKSMVKANKFDQACWMAKADQDPSR